ncbi:MAG: acetolactate synthase large subunit [Pseudomonadota bacterium]
MNGAESLLTTLTNNGISVCFANPGTSEMHFVAALDKVPGMRCVLCLFEGVASGAADGYARMTGKPACTLLHLGPGLGNALANIHNAKKGYTPMINIVGEHATYHVALDAPLASDIEGIATPVSHWVHTSSAAADIARDAAEAIRHAAGGRVATLMLPADVSWNDNPNGAEPAVAIARPRPISGGKIADAVVRLRNGKRTLIMIGGQLITADNGRDLSRIARRCGADIATDTFPARVARGAGTAVLPKLPYLAEAAIDYLQHYQQLILLGVSPPVAFFAYPGVPSTLAHEQCDTFVLADPDDDMDRVLADLKVAVGAEDEEPEICARQLPELGSGQLTADAVARSVARRLPDNAIVVDEALTCALPIELHLATAARHERLSQTGGSIGWGLPAAAGAAVACPERKVLALQADGSAMYTQQSLWTMARENLDVLIVIFNNRRYAILEFEFARTGAPGGKPGPKAASAFDIGNPDIDFVALAGSMGVQATRATTAEAFDEQLQTGLAACGPRLIEAIIQ